jgi:uncharacterized protein YndB with AHSA1/START domain
MTAARRSVRCDARITRPAGRVWAWVGDPARLAEWLPGTGSCTVDGDRREVTTGSEGELHSLADEPLQRENLWADLRDAVPPPRLPRRRLEAPV